MVIVLKAMRLHWLKLRPHWSKIKVQFLGQQRNGIPVAAALEKILLDGINGSLANLPEELDIDLSHLKTKLSMLPDLQSE